MFTARTPRGKEIVVSGGGVPVARSRNVHDRALNQATASQGLELTVTFASSSLAQNPANLLYLNLPFTTGARVTVGAATLRLPVLRSRCHEMRRVGLVLVGLAALVASAGASSTADPGSRRRAS